MKKIITLLLAACLLTGCAVDPLISTDSPASESTVPSAPESTAPGTTAGTEEPKIKFFRKVAREVQEDGWVWTFVQNGFKNGDVPPGLCVFQFNGMNFRHRYDDAYIRHNYTRMSHGMVLHTTYAPAIKLAGFGPEAEDRDMAKIDAFLASTTDPQELLSRDPDSLELEVVDKEMFFRLMRQALEGEPQAEGPNDVYWQIPSWGLLGEQEYMDGYKFQVGLANETGLVDVIRLDVAYKTGEEYNEYTILSDMVDDGTATAEQAEAYRLLETIARAMEQEESYIAMAEEYKALELGGIQFARLYEILNNIHNGNWTPYDINHVILDEERIPEEDAP